MHDAEERAAVEGEDVVLRDAVHDVRRQQQHHRHDRRDEDRGGASTDKGGVLLDEHCRLLHIRVQIRVWSETRFVQQQSRGDRQHEAREEARDGRLHLLVARVVGVHAFLVVLQRVDHQRRGQHHHQHQHPRQHRESDAHRRRPLGLLLGELVDGPVDAENDHPPEGDEGEHGVGVLQDQDDQRAAVIPLPALHEQLDDQRQREDAHDEVRGEDRDEHAVPVVTSQQLGVQDDVGDQKTARDGEDGTHGPAEGRSAGQRPENSRSF